MGDRRRNSVFAAIGGVTLAAALIFPSSIGFAYEAPAATAAPIQQISAPVYAAPAPVAAVAPLANDSIAPNPLATPAIADAGSAADDAPAAKPSYAGLDEQLECLAKVVHYESNGQPRLGQLAVAQVVINRAESGRFAKSICGVIYQRGQFAKIASHRPNRGSSGWRTAVDVAREALAGNAEHAAPGALYFHATHANAGAFKRHSRVTKIGGHIFYR